MEPQRLAHLERLFKIQPLPLSLRPANLEDRRDEIVGKVIYQIVKRFGEYAGNEISDKYTYLELANAISKGWVELESGDPQSFITYLKAADELDTYYDQVLDEMARGDYKQASTLKDVDNSMDIKRVAYLEKALKLHKVQGTLTTQKAEAQIERLNEKVNYQLTLYFEDEAMAEGYTYDELITHLQKGWLEVTSGDPKKLITYLQLAEELYDQYDGAINNELYFKRASLRGGSTKASVKYANFTRQTKSLRTR